MENDYADHLKKILPEIEFTRHIVKDDMFSIQMIHKSFPAVGETEEYLNYSMGNGFIFEEKYYPAASTDPIIIDQVEFPILTEDQLETINNSLTGQVGLTPEQIKKKLKSKQKEKLMLFKPKDGELRIYNRNGEYVEIMFYNFDFLAPINRNAHLLFSCKLADITYTQNLHDFFVSEKTEWYVVESIWDGQINFGKSWEVCVETNDITISEDENGLYLNFKGWIGSDAEVEKIDSFTEGIDVGKSE